MARTLVIAEIGACHDGDFDRALSLMAAAKDARADVAKFQFWSDPDRLADRRGVPAHYRAIYRRYRMGPSWLPLLRANSQRIGIGFMATCYLPADVALVAPYVTRFKVASFEAGAADLREAHVPFVTADSGKQVIVSLGMGGVPYIDAWANRFPGHVSFLHCVSAYPAPVEALQLRTLRTAARHGLLHGFSDHSSPDLTWTGAMAVVAGAQIVEAHLRLDDTDPENPDAPHAMTPRQFEDYVRHIRFAEACLGDGTGSASEPQACEQPMAQFRVQS